MEREDLQRWDDVRCMRGKLRPDAGTGLQSHQTHLKAVGIQNWGQCSPRYNDRPYQALPGPGLLTFSGEQMSSVQ